MQLVLVSNTTFGIVIFPFIWSVQVFGGQLEKNDTSKTK
jgi:hypothetical protein